MSLTLQLGTAPEQWRVLELPLPAQNQSQSFLEEMEGPKLVGHF